MWRDGKIHTGYYSADEWGKVLGPEERDQVYTAREGKSGGGGRKGKQSKGKSKKPDDRSKKIKALERTLTKKNKKISSLQRAPEDTDTSESDSSAELDNAGSKFGGRAEKQRAKKKQKKKK
jgi:hypothetical protein